MILICFIPGFKVSTLLMMASCWYKNNYSQQNYLSLWPLLHNNITARQHGWRSCIIVDFLSDKNNCTSKALKCFDLAVFEKKLFWSEKENLQHLRSTPRSHIYLDSQIWFPFSDNEYFLTLARHKNKLMWVCCYWGNNKIEAARRVRSPILVPNPACTMWGSHPKFRKQSFNTMCSK